MNVPGNRALLIYGAAAVAAIVVLTVIAKRGGAVGGAIGKGAGEFVGNAAGGVVIGLGNAVGLPDTTDAVVVGEGRAALARGDWFEASTKLPAPEFLSAAWRRLRGVEVQPDNVDASANRINYTDWS